MKLNRDLWYLKTFNILANFSKKELESVAQIFRLTEFDKREPIILADDGNLNIHFLVTGRAKLSRLEEDGRELILEILRPGEIFGHLTYPGGQYSSVQVVALKQCTVGHIAGKDFERLMQEKPELCLEIIKVIGSRLLKIENRLGELLFKTVPARMARLLLRLSDEYPHKNSCGVQIDMTLTQQEFANLIGASREAVSTALNQFRRNGWIAIHNHGICLHDVRAMGKLAK